MGLCIKWLWQPLVYALQFIWGYVCAIAEFLAQTFTWKNCLDLLLIIIGLVFHPVVGLHLAIITPTLTRAFFYQVAIAAIFVLPLSYWKIRDFNNKQPDSEQQFSHTLKVSAVATYAILSFATLKNYKSMLRILS